MSTHSVYVTPEPTRQMFRNDGDNWFMRRVMRDIQDGDPPTIIIGGKKRKGKCLEGKSVVSLSSGGLARLDTLVTQERTSVRGYGQCDFIPAIVAEHHANEPYSSFLKIETKHGHAITASEDHAFLTKEGWITANKLALGNQVATDFSSYFGDLAMPDHELILAAYLIAEGGLTVRVCFTNYKETILEDFARALHEFDPTLKMTKVGHGQFNINTGTMWQGQKNRLLTWLRYLGLFGHKSRDKQIPEIICMQKREKLALFLNRLFAGDGSAYWSRHKAKFEYCTASEVFAQQLHMLLMRFHIVSSVYECFDRIKGKPYYRLCVVRQESLHRLLTEIGIFDKDLAEFDVQVQTGLQRGYSTAPLDVDGDILWSPIRRIKDVPPPMMTYDLSVTPVENYVANGFVVHNSFMSMRIAEEIVLRCHQLKFAYRDKGLPTEKRYDLREAQFDVQSQLLYSLKSITSLLEPAPPLGLGLPFGSPIISDESSVTMNALAFNDRVVKQVVGIHDIVGIRLIPWIFNVPGSVLRIAYQIRETAQYMMQMKARGVAKVYEASPSVTGRVYLKTIGWLGYQNPFTGKVIARITPPTKNTVTVYNIIKDASVNKKLRLAGIKLRELASEGALGPFDSPDDFDTNTIMTMPKEHKRQIPTEDTEEGDEQDGV